MSMLPKPVESCSLGPFFLLQSQDTAEAPAEHEEPDESLQAADKLAEMLSPKGVKHRGARLMGFSPQEGEASRLHSASILRGGDITHIYIYIFRRR